MQLWESIKSVVLRPRTVLLLYVVAAIAVSVQLVLIGPHLFVMPPPATYAGNQLFSQQALDSYIGQHMTDYNNYVVFKRSYFHLVNGSNLYMIYPTEQWDYYKYSPTFALLMAPFSHLPDLLGLAIWNILNALALFLAVRMLPISVKNQCWVLLFVVLELITSMQNAQSNGLMCGLMIAAYGCMQRNKIVWATLWLVVATYIKVYGAIGFCLFLFYPGKLKFILYAALWTVLFTVLPLIVTPWHTLVWQYQNWAWLMKADAADSQGVSVAGWLHSWFGYGGKIYITIAGMLLFLLPLARYRMYGNQVYRMLMVASMLIWVIIFNHKAESPTYIIAVAGVGIWYFARPAMTWRTVLLWLTFIFTILATTDIFPPDIRHHYMLPYTIKAVPCILVWCALTAELMTMKGNSTIRQFDNSAMS